MQKLLVDKARVPLHAICDPLEKIPCIDWRWRRHGEVMPGMLGKGRKSMLSFDNCHYTHNLRKQSDKGVADRELCHKIRPESVHT